jgi:hypothetical protein
LASDPKVLKKTGKIHFTADLAREYKFTDINGKKLIFYDIEKNQEFQESYHLI